MVAIHLPTHNPLPKATVTASGKVWVDKTHNGNTSTTVVSAKVTVHLPLPPAMPHLPSLQSVHIPTSLKQYPANQQAKIHAWVVNHFPSAKTEAQIEHVLLAVVQAIGQYEMGNAKLLQALSVSRDIIPIVLASS